MFKWVRIFWESIKTGLSGSAGTLYTDDPSGYVDQLNKQDDGNHYFWEDDERPEYYDG